MSPSSRVGRLLALLLVTMLSLVACSADGPDPDPSPTVVEPALRTSDPDAALTVVADAGDHESSLATSRALFDASPVAVVAPSGDMPAQALSARAAVALGAPLLIEAPWSGTSASSAATPAPSAAGELSRALADELQRLETTRVLLIGASLPADGAGAGIAVEAVEPTERAARDAAGVAALAPGEGAAVLDDTVALTEDGPQRLGTPAAKLTTWAALQRDAPEGLHWGWKNFTDEDAPMLTPEETIGRVSPTPDLITYQ